MNRIQTLLKIAFSKLFMRYMPGSTINVKWPVGTYRVDIDDNVYASADPNDHYRPWLEANVGRQRIDWEWNIGKDFDHMIIKFRRGKERQMIQAMLMWA